MGRFHAQAGWSFEREPTGSVRIDSPKGTVILNADTWASAVAAVSHDGENRQTFDAAVALHGQTEDEKAARFEQANRDGFG